MPHNKLFKLRNTPVQAAEGDVFYVDARRVPPPVGGAGTSVSILPEIRNGIVVLNITPGGTDYFFPYVHGRAVSRSLSIRQKEQLC